MRAKTGMFGKLAVVMTIAMALGLLAPGALAELERLILKENGLVYFENGQRLMMRTSKNFLARKIRMAYREPQIALSIGR